MALIRIEHDDFVLQVSCWAYDALYAEAKRNIAEDALWASYACSDQGEPQFFSADDAEGVPSNVVKCWVNGRGILSREHYLALCKHLGVDHLEGARI